ncbi:MAG TPA: carbohydrate ABC transporter substrate-binding protein, partial [Ornithinibacter sp.]|nr:carbohydrate ABC transporter substrate-binding protein [Ornithinibacter sp.]
MALYSKRRIAALSGVLAVALTATACGGGDDGGGDDAGASAATGIDCAPYEAFGELDGKEVSV